MKYSLKNNIMQEELNNILDTIVLKINKEFPNKNPKVAIFGDGSWYIEVDIMDIGDGEIRRCNDISGPSIKELEKYLKL